MKRKAEDAIVSETEIVKKILDIQNSIRKKAAALKLARSEADESLTKLYEPLVEPLKQLSSNIHLPNDVNKKIEKTEEETIITKKSWPKAHQSSNELEYSFDPSFTSVDDEVFTSLEQPEKTTTEAFASPSHYDPITQRYIQDMLNIGLKKIGLGKFGYDASTYALKYDDKANKWYIGDSECIISANTLTIKGKTYPISTGLFELLLKSEPSNYNARDRVYYGEILESTNALRRDYSSNQQIQGSRAYKYVNIIKPMLSHTPVSSHVRSKKNKSTPNERNKSSKGHGLIDDSMFVDRNSHPSYVYWDDVNELVDRLYLLHSTKRASDNTGIHDNEIASIVEELRESGYIY